MKLTDYIQLPFEILGFVVQVGRLFLQLLTMKDMKDMKSVSMLVMSFMVASLTGCAVQTVSIDPRSAKRVESNQGADTQAAIVFEPVAHTFSWDNNNCDDPTVLTGLQMSNDLVNWQTIYETNCYAPSNSFTVDMTVSPAFFRAFNTRP